MPALVIVAPGADDPRVHPYRAAAEDLGCTTLVVAADPAAVGATPAVDVRSAPGILGAPPVAPRTTRKQDEDELEVEEASRPAGIVVVGREGVVHAAVLARRFGVAWHAPEAVRCSVDRLQQLGRLTALGTAVPRFAGVEAGSGVGVEQLMGLRRPWRVTVLPAGEATIVDDLEALRTLAGRARSSDGGEGGVERLAVEPVLEGQATIVVGLLDAGALRVVGMVDVEAGGPYPGTERRLAAPSSLARETQAHLAGLTAHACVALGLRQGPVLARAVAVDGHACLVDVAPGTLDAPASQVLRFVGPAGEPVDLATLVVRHALGSSLEGYALDGTFCAITLA